MVSGVRDCVYFPHFWILCGCSVQEFSSGVVPSSKVDTYIMMSSLGRRLVQVQNLQSSGEGVCSSVVCMDLCFIIMKAAAMSQ